MLQIQKRATDTWIPTKNCAQMNARAATRDPVSGINWCDKHEHTARGPSLMALDSRPLGLLRHHLQSCTSQLFRTVHHCGTGNRWPLFQHLGWIFFLHSKVYSHQSAHRTGPKIDRGTPTLVRKEIDPNWDQSPVSNEQLYGLLAGYHFLTEIYMCAHFHFFRWGHPPPG
jgi:hypothetical protein